MFNFDYLLGYIYQYQSCGYWLILLISCFESLAVVGVLVPGTTITIIFGFLASEGLYNIRLLILLSFVGAVLGDAFSYWMGLRGFKHEENFFKIVHLDLGQKFFIKHGGKSVFFGRFIGPLRPMIPFVAGLFRMSAKAFFFWNITSAFLWAVTNLLIGYFFGYAWRAWGAWPGRIGVMFLILIIATLVYYFRQYILKKKASEQAYENPD